MDSSDLSSSNGYCDKCHGLFSTVAALEALASPAGYQHHIGAEAKASADRGCPLCQKLLIKWPDRTSRETDQLVCWAARSGRRCQTNPAGFIPEIEVSVPYIFDGLICYRLGIGEHSHQRWLRTFTLFADSGDNAASLLPIRPPITDVGSESAIRRARQLFEACRDGHRLCPRARTPPLPTRAIDVGFIDSGDPVRLHIASPGECRDYAALSYCWGGLQPVLLTAKNLKEMTESIPLDSLPQTIKDTIRVTRGLGIRFLWVDALCIIQDGDANDKVREIDRMGKLYRSATVTIFAASAKAVSDGFLQPRLTLSSFSLPIKCADGKLGTAKLTIGDNHDFMHPLNTRGWTLQETLLSSRKLVYGEKELVWDCETQQKEEFQSSYFEPVQSFRQLPPEILAPNSGVLTGSKADEIWRSILSEFTARRLSFPEDRLAAVAGVIAELQPAFQDECVFGLWRSSFIQQLAWFRWALPCAVDENAILRCAPEWSWASRVYETDFLQFEPEDKQDWEVRDREVVLHRRLRRGHDIPAGPSDNWTIYLDFKEPEAEPKSYYARFCFEQDGEDVFYFPLGRGDESSNGFHEITMAVVREGRDDTFRRVGVVSNLSGKSWFEHVGKQRIVLI